MDTHDEAELLRARDSALNAARVLEGLQLLREAEAREPWRRRLEAAKRWHDSRSSRLRGAVDKLAAARARAIARRAALSASPWQHPLTTLVLTWWRLAVLLAWGAAVGLSGEGWLALVAAPAVGAGLAVARTTGRTP